MHVIITNKSLGFYAVKYYDSISALFCIYFLMV